VLAASVWISFWLVGDAVFVQMFNVPASPLRHAIEAAVQGLSAYEQLALLFLTLAAVVVWAAGFTVIGALWVCYPRRGNLAASVLLCLGLSLSLLTLAARYGFVPVYLADALFVATRWIALAAVVFCTVHVFRRGLEERVLSVRYICAAAVISVAVDAAWLTALNAFGARLSPWTPWPILLPFMASLLVPWSLNRLRHA
jgi:hypothetical protein